MKRTFVELPAFAGRREAGLIEDDEFRLLQADMMTDQGVTIAGTNGLRKIRCRRPGHGKRGGCRVIYADYPRWSLSVLVTVFPKNVQANLSPAERRELGRLKLQLDRELEAIYGKQSL